MSKLLFLGECMVELSQRADGSLKQSFAGDVFNTAAYLKRAFPEFDSGLVTVIGNDPFSQSMARFFGSEHINTDLVLKSTSHQPGLYAIHTDASGERSFTYWRENSAARELMSMLTPPHWSTLQEADWLFFSGISLAVIQPKDRPEFWQLVDSLKAAGVKVAFDPNYRPRLWSSPEEAKAQLERGFACADLLLPGVDDFTQLYGMDDPEQIAKFCEQFDCPELVLKNGENGIFVHFGDKPFYCEIEPVEYVVDTTSAGDSFNGVYLGARVDGIDIREAITLASKAAGYVIQHPGAMVPQELFLPYMERQRQELLSLA